MTAADAAALVDDAALRASVPAVEVAETFLRRLEQAQPQLHAMITITPELALEDARAVDEARARGERLPLDGMPLVLKDNVDVAGVRTTVGSRLFADRIGTEDATVTRLLRASGGVILGKANMHELAFGATSANQSFGAVVNPAAPDRIPGGSSGGSGAAVAADLCVAAIGTDTGGSIRLPASLCGVSGLRPTYGAVSNRGVQHVSAALDTVGPLARAVTDVRRVLSVIAGFDPQDPTSIDVDLDLGGADTVDGLRIGVVDELVDRSDADVAACARDVAELLAGLGATLTTVELPGWEDAAEMCGRLIRAEAVTLYGDDAATRPELFEEGTLRRLALAVDFGPSAIDALRSERARWSDVMDRALADVDLLLLPTIPVSPPAADGADNVDTTNEVVPYTFVLAFAHVPSVSIPGGRREGAPPIGLMVAAPRGRDGLVLRAAAAVQAETDWHRRRPSL